MVELKVALYQVMAFLVFLLFSLLCLSSSSSSTSNAHRSILDLDLTKYTTEAQVSSLFQLWKSENGRVYKNQEEESKKLEIFQSNLNYIRDMNAKRKPPHSHRLGLNKFADITLEEFSKTYLQAPKDVSRHIKMAKKRDIEELPCCCDNAPESWDWREKGVITDVKYQGQCGSGWAFSATGAIEAVHAIATGNLVSLSAQELVDCVEESEGCYNGWPYQSFEWVVKNGGIATEDEYPYEAKDGRCKANKMQERVTIDGYQTLLLSNDSVVSESETEKALLCATFEQPITVSIDAKNFHLYTGGIYDGKNCSVPYGINHFVLIVGYGSEDGVDYWIAKNSWGKDWGMDGYIRIKRNTGDVLGVCGMNYFAAYPTKEKPETFMSAPRMDHSPL